MFRPLLALLLTVAPAITNFTALSVEKAGVMPDAESRRNLTYWEFPALGSSGQSHLSATLAMAPHWAISSKPTC